LSGTASLGGSTAILSTAGTQSSDDGQSVALLGEIRDELRRLGGGCARPCGEIAQLRDAQHAWLRATGKFPQFIEVGIDVWEGVSDWYLGHQHPLTVTRVADGRYAMRFGETTLVLRPDLGEGYVSAGYDAK
jgi:hypothetical protein